MADRSGCRCRLGQRPPLAEAPDGRSAARTDRRGEATGHWRTPCCPSVASSRVMVPAAEPPSHARTALWPTAGGPPRTRRRLRPADVSPGGRPISTTADRGCAGPAGAVTHRQAGARSGRRPPASVATRPRRTLASHRAARPARPTDRLAKSQARGLQEVGDVRRRVGKLAESRLVGSDTRDSSRSRPRPCLPSLGRFRHPAHLASRREWARAGNVAGRCGRRAAAGGDPGPGRGAGPASATPRRPQLASGSVVPSETLCFTLDRNIRRDVAV